MGRERAVRRANRPAIVFCDASTFAHGDDRFDGEHHSVPQHTAFHWVRVVRYRGRLMDAAPDTVSREFADHRVPVAAYRGVHLASNVAHHLARGGDFHGFLERLLRAGDEWVRLLGAISADDAFGCVGHESTQIDGDVELNDV